jgi:hypothetical protein
VPFNALASQFTTSTTSPVLIANDASYNPNSSTHAGFAGGSWDLGIIGADGMNFVTNEFDAVTIIAGSVEIGLTGVSNLNRQGRLYLAEDQTNLHYRGDAADTANAQNQVNLYPLSALTKLQHNMTVDVINLKQGASLKYNFIPATGYSNMYITEPATPAVGAVNAYPPCKQFVFVISGAASTTSVVMDFTVVAQCRPQVSQLNKFPARFTSCF